MMKLKVISPNSNHHELELNESSEYFIGRDESNDIVILDSKISRKHARIFFENNEWFIEKLSQVGKIIKNSFEIETTNIEHGDQLQIGSYNISVEKEDLVQSKVEEKVELSQSKLDIEEYIEETTAGASLILESYLRITYSNGNEELLKLEGNHWVIGRGDDCDIQLKDGRTSRKHIVISKKANLFQIKDLGSSNGSHLNGKKIPSDQETSLVSGDNIELGSTRIRFEIRSANFDEQIEKMPSVGSAYPAIIHAGSELHQQNRGQIIEIKNAGPLGMVIPDSMQSQWENTNRSKKKLVYAALVALLLIFIFNYGEDTPQTESTVTASTNSDPYEKLSEEQKKYINDSYNLAYQFYTQGQYELAIGETQKIHNLLPDGYIDKQLPDRNSKVLAQHAEDGLRIEQERARLAEVREQKRVFNEKMDEIFEQCKAKEQQYSSSQMDTCLAPLLANRPNDPKSMQLIASIKQKEDEKRAQVARRIALNSRIESGEDLFEKAQQVEKEGNIPASIQAYKEHLASSYPDPNSLKSRSQRKVTELSMKVREHIDKNLIKAQNLYELEKYKECIEVINEILKLDPKNTQATEKYALAKTLLHQNLKKDYQESIFKEAHGDIDEAKKIWIEIMRADVKGGEYYNKAEIKLKRIGFTVE